MVTKVNELIKRNDHLDCRSFRTGLKSTELNLACQALLFVDIILFYIQSE